MVFSNIFINSREREIVLQPYRIIKKLVTRPNNYCLCVSAEFRRFSAVLTISIALAANIGGTATLIGSGPNVVLVGITDRSRHKHAHTEPFHG